MKSRYSIYLHPKSIYSHTKGRIYRGSLEETVRLASRIVKSGTRSPWMAVQIMKNGKTSADETEVPLFISI